MSAGEMFHQYYRTRIRDITRHGPNIQTFTLDLQLEGSKPGQFIMVPLDGLDTKEGVDEKPFSLSGLDRFTVRRIGPFTQKLFEKQVGDHLRVRGPYGSGTFPIGSGNIAIGGGCGIAPLAFYLQQHQFPTLLDGMVLAAKTKDELAFVDEAVRYFRWQGLDGRLIVMTEDGSLGNRGLVTDAQIPPGKRYLVCGPEPMMANVAENLVRNGVASSDIFLSLERYMKCAIGICGECSFSGYRVCSDGPVFTYQTILEASKLTPELNHFNRFHRTRTGELVPLRK
jgi:dihydroorotate dehydrogenase electron transfer subunit